MAIWVCDAPTRHQTVPNPSPKPPEGAHPFDEEAGTFWYWDGPEAVIWDPKDHTLTVVVKPCGHVNTVQDSRCQRCGGHRYRGLTNYPHKP